MHFVGFATDSVATDVFVLWCLCYVSENIWQRASQYHAAQLRWRSELKILKVGNSLLISSFDLLGGSCAQCPLYVYCCFYVPLNNTMIHLINFRRLSSAQPRFAAISASLCSS